MKIGKIIIMTACSLLMSGAAFAEIVPTPADNSMFELSVMTEKISAVGEDYGKASSMLSSFFDSSIGQASMEGQTPVYAGGDYTNTQSRNNKTMYPGIPCSPANQSEYPNQGALINTNKSSPKNLNDKDIQYDFSRLSKAIHRVCVASHQKKVCISREVCEMVCSGAIGAGAGAIGGAIGGVGTGTIIGGAAGAGSVPVCKKVCRLRPECSMVTVCDRYEYVETNGSVANDYGSVVHQ